MTPAFSRPLSSPRDLIAMAFVLGTLGGLIEGVGHMALQRLNLLENVWYPIIWIAMVFNGVGVGALGAMIAGILTWLPNRSRVRMAAIFAVVVAACLPWLALMLKDYLRWYAIAAVILGVSAAATRVIGRHEASIFRGFRRSVPWTVALAIMVFAGIEGGAWLKERRGTSALPAADVSAPNILVIIVDALRADHLSSYGYSRRSSPALDRLAAEGVLFEQAFSTSSYTLPSHASIVTGRYPYDHGVEWGSSHQMAAHPTLPQVLQTRGYRTGAFSGNTYWFTREHGFGNGFLHFEDFFHSFADMAFRTAYGRIVAKQVRWRLGSEDIPARKHAADINRAVFRWTSRDPEHPFFVMINYMDVHDPYLPPQPFRSRFSKQPEPGGLINWERHVPERLTPAEMQSEIDAYDGSIAYVDDRIDQLVSTLRRSQTRDLLVIVTSDHGEEFGEHGGVLHGWHLHREVIHVPLIVWQPGRVPSGLRIARPVTNAAVAATVMSVLGAAGPTFPVQSLQPLWDSPETAAAWPHPLSEMKRRPWELRRAAVRYGSIRSLVSPALHYIEHDTQGPQLFDWTTDPAETRNLAGRPDLQPAIERFREELTHLRTTGPTPAPAGR